ncbi:MAG: 2-C-methyl-D-erythritol 2,4-cyclodiphosphate synthase [Candidatus Omnitrophica bacterium]|nr:2-C-methyl-D-erythritol 2,4-cyclodiphosphate synthase [Candidatus Omnitrophota bacterium]
MDYRVGIGYDIHRLGEQRKFILGGIEIPYLKGLTGHSDADVLLHAMCDALLGAINKGDIGEYFPDNHPEYQGISSTELLLRIKKMVKEERFEIVNLDAVIITEEPRLSPFKLAIKKNISQILQIDSDLINIKAKTNEGLGPIGRKEAVACWVAVLLKRKE